MLCGLPAGQCELNTPVVMINLLGDVWGDSQPKWNTLLGNDNIKLHLYGKQAARVGRKMGHFNVLADSTASAMTLATSAFTEVHAD
jgi:5-(carboxyamino)imidazole ribonucleotide synthase